MADGIVEIKVDLDNEGLKNGLKDAESQSTSAFGKIADIGKTAFKAIATASVAVGTAVAGIAKSAVESFAEYEQLVGGVDTLFKDSSDKVQRYAQNAYQTAGLSANEYMDTVTSFSASLLQSLDGDTDKAAESANQAITDMADNANKMGTSMESIQNAYQGFAKQNYTMLDNLKLGYGGTKEEMERLLSDASKLSGQKYDISNLNDVYDAIHVIQTDLGITGTTAKEASTTISGSMNMLKSSWANLLTAFAGGDVDIDEALLNVMDSLTTFAGNIMPVVETALKNIVQYVGVFIDEQAPTLIQGVIQFVTEQLPTIIQLGITLIKSLVQGIVSNLPIIIEAVQGILTSFTTYLTENLPMLLNSAIEMLTSFVTYVLDNIDFIIDLALDLITSLADGLITALPTLIEKAPIIITSFCNAIIRNFPKIVQTAGELMGKLAMGIIGNIVKLVETVPQLVNAFCDAFNGFWEQIKNVGVNFVKGLWERYHKHGTMVKG